MRWRLLIVALVAALNMATVSIGAQPPLIARML